MKIELIRQRFNDTRGYKFKPFMWCCDKIKENPAIELSDKVCIEGGWDDAGECTFPAIALRHTEVCTDWDGDFEDTTYYKLSYCPFCGESIEISVVGEEDVNNQYEELCKQRDELWQKHCNTDSKKKAEYLYRKVQELDRQINWFYGLAEYKNVKENDYVSNDFG